MRPFHAGRTSWSKGMICLVARTKAPQYWQAAFFPFTSLTPSHARQTFVFSPALATFIRLRLPRHLRVVQPETLDWSLHCSCWLLVDVPQLPGKYPKKISRRDRDQGSNGKEFCRGRFTAESLLSRDAF